MITPPYLSPGDKVAIVSTARKVSEDEMLPAVELFKSWNLLVEFGKNLFRQLNQFAGTDEERLHDFQSALDDPSVKAILFARGGYGTVRIIDQVDWTAFRANPKWLIGFSDVTVTHSHVNKLLGIETLHAPMAFNLAKSTLAVKHALKQALFGEKLTYTVEENVLGDLNRQGSASGELVGGNLSILYSLLGSASGIETAGKILFLEDLDEYLYHVDRMMVALKRAGKLYKLAGLIVGGMNDMKDNKVRFNKTAEEIISETVAGYSFPVLCGFPAGHIRSNMPLILGRKVTLNVQVDSTLVF
jgi:muramoyltetrapeptide carboxypeptidase